MTGGTVVLKGKFVLLGITGGIAAYKAVELTSRLVRDGAEVHVIMTRAAREFIGPLTFEAISGRPVNCEMFDPSSGSPFPHLDLARCADIMVVVPATANILAKAAHGLADDLLTTTLLAVGCPVLFCPAMNVNMYLNPVVQENIKLLRRHGYHVIEPAVGRQACGDEGPGRLAEVDAIYRRVVQILNSPYLDLQGVKLLVTAGPTREPLDPVRYITNRSSGKMGYSIAEAAVSRGARVILVSGPTPLTPPAGVEFVPVETAREMYEAVMKHFVEVDVVIKAAAVADYRPARVEEQKIKKREGELVLVLEKNPDILAELGRLKGRQVLVGFAAETQELEKNALEKLRSKNLDLLVANDVTRPGAGFDVDTNIVTIFYPDGSAEHLPQMSKIEVGHQILDRVKKYLSHKQIPQ